MWALGNSLCPLIIKTIGLGVGMATWFDSLPLSTFRLHYYILPLSPSPVLFIRRSTFSSPELLSSASSHRPRTSRFLFFSSLNYLLLVYYHHFSSFQVRGLHVDGLADGYLRPLRPAVPARSCSSSPSPALSLVSFPIVSRVRFL